MYDAWYNKITKDCSLKFDLGMTDTDSFLFKVSDGELFRLNCKDFMDYSNYPPNHKNFSSDHKSELGYFKDELLGINKCLEFVGLRSKCYALNLKNVETNEVSDKKTAKGIGKAAIKKSLTFEKYKKCLFESLILRETFHTIRSKKHNISTVAVTKKALSFVDTKRYQFECGIHSVPYGHEIIKAKPSQCPYCN